jgi:hypothetical protein
LLAYHGGEVRTIAVGLENSDLLVSSFILSKHSFDEAYSHLVESMSKTCLSVQDIVQRAVEETKFEVCVLFSLCGVLMGFLFSILGLTQASAHH